MDRSFGSAVFVAALATAAAGQVTQRVSLSSAGAQGNLGSYYVSLSADGRYVAFMSHANNLVSGDTNGFEDIFVRDRRSGTTERVSVDSAEVQGNRGSDYPSLSADGRYVAFVSDATNLVSGDTNGALDVFVRDRLSGTTERVSVSTNGAQGLLDSGGFFGRPSISADGHYVAFESEASNLVPGDTNGFEDIFVRDRQSGTTERVSIDSAGVQGNMSSFYPSISADGRYVAFMSYSNNLVSADTNGSPDIFVRDRVGGTTERVSVSSAGVQGNLGSYFPSLSADGRYVAFMSTASDLVAGDTNGHDDVFVRDRQLGTTEIVSVDSGGVQGSRDSGYNGVSISGDGRYVAFDSDAPNLVSGDSNGSLDIFVHDRSSGTTERASVDSAGAEGNFGSGTFGVSISADGRCVAFDSYASNLVFGDTNVNEDIFVRDRFGGPSFTSLCHPGVGGVIACPCANPPSGPGQGCNNSSATGGAILSGSGGTYLSSDSLVFTTSGEMPTALSVLFQGTTPIAGGAVYGQGIRCLGGALRRLYTKSASGGSITAPDFGAGDSPVSVRSAALGDMILAGQSRWYLVYYSDPTVIGGCPASSGFNATQTGRIDWSP